MGSSIGSAKAKWCPTAEARLPVERAQKQAGQLQLHWDPGTMQIKTLQFKINWHHPFLALWVFGNRRWAAFVFRIPFLEYPLCSRFWWMLILTPKLAFSTLPDFIFLSIKKQNHCRISHLRSNRRFRTIPWSTICVELGQSDDPWPCNRNRFIGGTYHI